MTQDAVGTEYGHRLCRHGDLDQYLISLFGEQYKSYRKKWELTCSPDVHNVENDLPLHISFELADKCNLRCSFCYRNLSEQSNAVMDPELFTSIMQEIKTLGIPAIDLCFGEPLVHPRAEELIRLAGQSGLLEFILTTNGLLLSETMIEACLDSLTRIHISVDAATPETYKKVRGGNLKTLERNIHNFLAQRERRGVKYPVVRLSFVVMEENKHEMQPFIDKWYDKVDYIDFQDYVSHEYVDALMDIDSAEGANIICPDPFRYLAVRANGDVFPCCTFYSKHLLLSNYQAEPSLSAIWNSPKMVSLRQSFRDGRPCKPCLNCKLGTSSNG